MLDLFLKIHILVDPFFSNVCCLFFQCGKELCLTETIWKSDLWDWLSWFCFVWGWCYFMYLQNEPICNVKDYETATTRIVVWFLEFWWYECALFTLPSSTWKGKIELQCLQSVWEKQEVYNTVVWTASYTSEL